MDLIIVESPTKAKTLGRFLGEDYKIVASMGHVRDLPQSRLGIDVNHDFAPEYTVSPKNKPKVDALQAAAKGAKNIILATDPDREGEAIAYHIFQILSGKSENSENQKIRESDKSDKSGYLSALSSPIFWRITFHEITDTAIKEALAKPGEINMPLVEAQQARRILDRLVGYKLSPLLWRKIRRGLSAGRVQSVAVRLIVEKEREILAFKPQEYWEILAKFAEGFEAKLKQELKNKDEVDQATQKLQTAQYKIENIESKEVKKYPFPPFTTSTMQQAASNLFGWSAKRTMQAAQRLYEEGLITYHRTDSTNLAMEAINQAREYVSREYGVDYLPESPRFFKTKSKVAQEAHEAIRPTNINDRSPDRLYELIWKRFLACQMAEGVYKQTGVDISADGYQLRATGLEVIFDGWKKLYGRDEEDKENKLPQLSVGQILKLLELLPSQHFTEPPARYTEASLIKALEEYGIGRPSTYAPIITTIQDRQYVEKEERKLLPTNLGFAVNDFLMTNFANPDVTGVNIMDYQFTAGMEDELDNIANGEKPWVPVIRKFYDPFAKQLETVQATAQRVKVETEATDEKCPNDGAPLVIRIGRFGKFLACSKFPDCKFTKQFVKKLGIACPKCGGDVVIKRTKNKKTFYGCSNYPKCDFASWTKPKVEKDESQDKKI